MSPFYLIVIILSYMKFKISFTFTYYIIIASHIDIQSHHTNQ